MLSTSPAVGAVRPASGAGWRALLGWRRVRFTLLAALPYGLLVSIGSETSTAAWVLRAEMVGLSAMLAYGVCEQWPQRLPPWLARWVLQLLGIVVVVPFAALLAYAVTTGGHPDFANEPKRLGGYVGLCFAGILFAPWLALAAMVRQREALARHQALSFQLERSELERQALDARLQLMQAQVQPHFLFNTLANVREQHRA
jgi:Histidine kinase